MVPLNADFIMLDVGELSQSEMRDHLDATAITSRLDEGGIRRRAAS